jgi:hypothetical protein
MKAQGMRRYLNATAAGILGGLMIAFGSTWAALHLHVWWQMRQTTGGGGLGAASVTLGWTLLAAIVGFVIVFFATVAADARGYSRWVWRLLLLALAFCVVYFWMNADS